MKQLLIVNSAKALNAGTSVTGFDLSGLDKGAISFFYPNETTLLSGVAMKNFGIALGRGANKPAFVIPEVDVNTLEITHTFPYAGATFEASFTMPTAVVGNEYTVILVKKGVVPHERNLFTTTIVAKTTTAADVATAFRKAINDKTNDLFPFTASGSSTTVTITCNNAGEDYEIKFADELASVTTTSLTHGKPAIGDAAFLSDLARRSAAGKGFVYLDNESLDINPGFPEDVEEQTLNTSGSGTPAKSTVGYKIYNLHFATGRVAGKQVDERVWQYVHIAVPLTKADGTTKAAALDSLDAILPEGYYVTNMQAAATSAAITAAAQE